VDTPDDYPYIRASGRFLFLPEHEIDREVARARAACAPTTVAYRTADNQWITASELFQARRHLPVPPLADLAAVVIRDRIHTALEHLDATQGPLDGVILRPVDESTLALHHASGWTVRVTVAADTPPPRPAPSAPEAAIAASPIRPHTEESS
jgi:hypothetical protein